MTQTISVFGKRPRMMPDADHLRVGQDRRAAGDGAPRCGDRLAVPGEVIHQIRHAAGMDHAPRHRAQLLRQGIEPRFRLDGRERLPIDLRRVLDVVAGHGAAHPCAPSPSSSPASPWRRKALRPGDPQFGLQSRRNSWMARPSLAGDDGMERECRECASCASQPLRIALAGAVRVVRERRREVRVGVPMSMSVRMVMVVMVVRVAMIVPMP